MGQPIGAVGRNGELEVCQEGRGAGEDGFGRLSGIDMDQKRRKASGDQRVGLRLEIELALREGGVEVESALTAGDDMERSFQSGRVFGQRPT